MFGSFFSKLQSTLPYIQKGSILAGGLVGGKTGAALAVVNTVLTAEQNLTNPVAAVTDATKAVAVAVDDHEGRMQTAEETISSLQAEVQGLKGLIQNLTQNAK